MRENKPHAEQDTNEVELTREDPAKRTGAKQARTQGTCAADAFMREVERGRTGEQVEDTMRQQGVGIQTIMNVQEALQALQQDTEALIGETMRKLSTDGRTQIAIRDGEKWAMVMLTITSQDMQAHVWLPTGGIEKQDELLIAVDVWTILREAYDLQKVKYSGLKTHSTPPEWGKFSQGEQAIRVAGSWKYWHVDGKPGHFKLGTRNTARLRGETREMRRTTEQTTGPAEEDVKSDEPREDGRAPTTEQHATGEATGEKNTSTTDKLVQATLRFRPISKEQANERLKKEEETATGKKLRPPANAKKYPPPTTTTKMNKRDNEETRGSLEALKQWGGNMPKTENLNIEEMREAQQHTVKFLTWNIQGARHSLYELEEQMEKWGIDIAIVTETKTANEEIKRHFRNKKQSNICTSIPTEEGEGEESNHKAGLAVILTGEYAKPHNYTEVQVPHLRGVLTHTLLHSPGGKYLHLLGVYYPVEGKDVAEETGRGELDREAARNGIQEYVRMVTTASENAAGQTVLICGDLNATTGTPKNSRDKEWNKTLEATGLQDVGGTRETTLTWHERRNIDRMLASKAELQYYTQPTAGELTELHMSDHKMVCTTQLDLKAWGTHRPTAQKPQHAKTDRLKLPLTEAEGNTLRQTLDAAYTKELQDEMQEAINGIKTATSTRHRKRAIDYAGGVVARIMGKARDRAMMDVNLPKQAAAPEQQHGLHLPKTLRKERDGHLKERNRCRENIASWKKDIEAREQVTEEVRTEDFDNRTSEMRKWEQWEREQKKLATKEARKCIKEHEANRKQKTRMKMREGYWGNIKHYHKLIYKKEIENGTAPATTIQAMETIQGELVVGHQKVAQAMGEHIAWSEPYKMKEPEKGLKDTPPWLDERINEDKTKITGVEHGNKNVKESRHQGVKCGSRTLKVLKAGDTYKYLGVLLNMLGTWKEEKRKSLQELKRRIDALLATPLTQRQKEYSLKSAILGKFKYGLHLGIYTQGEIQKAENQLGAAMKRIYGLPANGTPNELNTEEKEEYGLGLQSLQAIYAQEVYTGLAGAVQSEEDKGAQMGYGKRERNLQTRQRMSQVSRSTAGLLEKHFEERGHSSTRSKLKMGLQTQTNTLRKMNALNEYGIRVKGVGNHMQELGKETLPIMRQLGKAKRVYTNAEMEGTTRTTKHQRIMDTEYRDPQSQPATTGFEKMGTVNVIQETKTQQATKQINFTKLLTLFRNYPDLKNLTTVDGKSAIPIETLKATGGRKHDTKTATKIAQGMLHLYPYICEAQPNDIKKPGDHWDHVWNRRLKPEYIQERKTGELERYTKSTTSMENISDWPAQIKALHEAGNSLKDILQLLSMYPLANQTKHFEQSEVEWTEHEKEVLGIETDQEKEEDDVMTTRHPRGRVKRKSGQQNRGQWSTQEDRMDVLGQEGNYTPAGILATRQYLQNYTDSTSKVTQYEIRWTDGEGNEQTTWSTEETVRTHLLKHNLSSDQGWKNLVEEWKNDKRDKRTKREPAEEILAGQPNGEQRYWKEVTHLEICTRETNPDQDIRHIPGVKDRQLRTEGDTTYCHEPEGSLIGTLSTVKVRELYDRYAEAVGDSTAQRPTEKQLAKRLKLSVEHKIHVSTFEEEIAQLLIRYSSKAEMKHRKRNLQNHWTFPPEMMEAVHTAMGVQTEVFASPLNVHKDTRTYYSQYPRDSVFGAVGSAWEEQWEKLGSYQFNPEYTAGDLYKALKKAINSTKTAEPVLGVGIYPTYAKSPYRKLLNKHMGYRVHELLEIKEGQFTFLPPDHWMQGNLQKPKQCNWNMRILIVANAAGWRKYCPDALKTHDIFSKALLKCPQSKVKTIGRACYIHRPLTLKDADRQPRSITEWEKDCVIDSAPWMNHELPVMQALPDGHLENHTEEIIERWMEDREKEGEHRGGDKGPRPTTMDVLRANTTWSREEINRDALRRWALQFAGPDTTDEHINGDQWLQWEKGEMEKAEPPPESRWDSQGKGYPEPHRRHDGNNMIYTDGSQRKVKKENGEVEDVTAAEEWETKRQRIERTEAEYAQKNREPTEIETAWADTWPDEPEWQQEQEEELELQKMERLEEEALIQEQQVQTAQQAKQKRGQGRESTRGVEMNKEQAWKTRTIQKEEALEQGERQKRRRTQSQAKPDQPAPREAEGPREAQGETAQGSTQKLKLPETQNVDTTTQQDTAAELREMAQQQEEAQEEWRALQEMVQD
ncbi:hypothetical protein CYMTET_3361 [Cymbomonas tetramitiformis]|uniref:Endonuclease/exonuclease/phosphatase domain-containing protein n=1 Tax=Cymbomonas tetramitiformis TaxID=36881 RepID=A0AAE0H3V8_9CHLO|nr:hypothetical protein CYMTET_3361 [Cymbomonas tetramitiformis]